MTLPLAHPVRRALALAALALPTLAGAPAAQGAVLSSVLPGVLSPAQTAATCPSAEQTFLPWGDASYYQLGAGGSFEGTPGWSLTGGAGVVKGNETFYVNAPTDTHSLTLPAGATATSPATCFDAGDVKMRLFARGSGKVKVTVLVRDALGVLSTLDGGTFAPGAAWQPSPEVSLLVTSLGGAISTSAIQIRLTAVGAPVQVDDVYVDPFKSV